jgi:hypothetical protein
MHSNSIPISIQGISQATDTIRSPGPHTTDYPYRDPRVPAGALSTTMSATSVTNRWLERGVQGSSPSVAGAEDEQLLVVSACTDYDTPLGLALRAAFRVAILLFERLRASSACFRDNFCSGLADLCFTS